MSSPAALRAPTEHSTADCPLPIRSAAILDYLDDQISQLLGRIQEQEFWQVLTSPHSDPAAVQAIMREIYLEIVFYQPHVIEATISAIAQMPRSLNPRLFRSMLIHQAEEFDHGEMALKDYLALGGDEQYARNCRISPASFAVAGMWLMLAHMRDPFAYLGAVYLFEGLTPTITAAVKSHLTRQGMGPNSLGYIEFHSTEDVRHANLMRHVIQQVAEQYPESAGAMKHGLECFLQVYPLPVWQAAYERARQ